MSTVLDVLYDALRPDEALPEELAILKREEAFLDELERRIGIEDFTRFWDVVSEIGSCRAAFDFRLGVWAGANFVFAAGTAPFPQK